MVKEVEIDGEEVDMDGEKSESHDDHDNHDHDHEDEMDMSQAARPYFVSVVSAVMGVFVAAVLAL
jgi:ABC-type Zn2+ transport system substrate-binding protein/surface adhesin